MGGRNGATNVARGMVQKLEYTPINVAIGRKEILRLIPVSYTHLTLPTKRIV